MIDFLQMKNMNINTDEGRKEALANLNEMRPSTVDSGAAFSYAIGLTMGHLNTGKKNFSMEEVVNLIDASFEYGSRMKKGRNNLTNSIK